MSTKKPKTTKPVTKTSRDQRHKSSKSNADSYFEAEGFMAERLTDYVIKAKPGSIRKNETTLDRAKRLVAILRSSSDPQEIKSVQRKLLEFNATILYESGACSLQDDRAVCFSAQHKGSRKNELLEYKFIAKDILEGYKHVFEDIVNQQGNVDANKEKERRNLLDRIKETDLSTVEKQDDFMKILFSNEDRKKVFSPVQCKMIERALEANKNSQGFPGEGWRKSGFGFLTYFFGSKLSLLLFPVVKKMLATKYNIDYVPVGPAGIIFKPSLGRLEGSLPAHIDEFSYKSLCETTKKYVLDDLSVDHWCQQFGVQSLLHFTGSSKKGGFTQVVVPMTPQRMFLCSLAMDSSNEFFKEDEEGYCSSTTYEKIGGPIFFEWFDVKFLAKINCLLTQIYDNTLQSSNAEHMHLLNLVGENERRMYPMRDVFLSNLLRVSALKPNDKEEIPYLVAWPKGFPHGSMVSNGASRLTFAFNMESSTQVNDDHRRKQARFLIRLFATADFIHLVKTYHDNDFRFLVPLSETSLQKFKTDLQDIVIPQSKDTFFGPDPLWCLDFIDKDLVPFAGGKVHATPRNELKIIPYYSHLYATRDDIHVFMREMDLRLTDIYRDYQDYVTQRPEKEKSSRKTVKQTGVENQTSAKGTMKKERLLQQDAHIVRQGFIINATYVPAIISGRKRFENRDFKIKPGYYGLYVSKSKKEMRDEFFDKEATLDEIKALEGHIVGILHVLKAYERGNSDFPNDLYVSDAAYTHSIEFIPITEYIDGEYKVGQINYMMLSPSVSGRLTEELKRHDQS